MYHALCKGSVYHVLCKGIVYQVFCTGIVYHVLYTGIMYHALHQYYVLCALHRYCVPSVLHRYCVPSVLHRYCVPWALHRYHHALHRYHVSCSAQVLCTMRSSQVSCTMRSAQIHMQALLQQHGAGVHTCWPSFCLPAFSFSDIGISLRSQKIKLTDTMSLAGLQKYWNMCWPSVLHLAVLSLFLSLSPVHAHLLGRFLTKPKLAKFTYFAGSLKKMCELLITCVY